MRVLIANRGEIVARVIRSCHELGVEAVAVFTDADAEARLSYLEEPGRAVRIESYLDGAEVLRAARETGATAIHPGYGFLSESADFAQAVIDAGLTWIGPPPSAMRAMARKDHAREIAEKAGVPVTPRYDPAAVPDDAYPVLVKAAAGGGGKGMHVVRTAAELAEAMGTAAREARSAFGDDTLIVERYVEGGRHVEVQVFGSDAGVVHFGTRDCSVQRRHQKVVEEAPAPDLSDALRELLHSSAVALATEVGYRSAGTVEFLVHGESAYFLEMNTRLQVEHPVTEEVYGVDLVALQLEAAGVVSASDTDGGRWHSQLEPIGHAIEARIYAENPYAGFLPQAGPVLSLHWPTDRCGSDSCGDGGVPLATSDPIGVRIESALTAGGRVGTAYDPMLAKMIASGGSREEARRRMVAALDGTVIAGVTTNTGFLRRLVASDEFKEGEIHTGWLDSPAAAELLAAPELPEEVGRAAAAAWIADHRTGGPFGTADGWRSAGPAAEPSVAFEQGSFRAAPQTGVTTAVDRHGVWATRHGQTWRLAEPDPFGREHQQTSDGTVASPMPGTVLEVRVGEGDVVAVGDVLAVMEAMKMELSLKAPLAGRVTRVTASPGSPVGLGDTLFEIEGEDV